MTGTNRSADLIRFLREQSEFEGLGIVKITSTEPGPYGFTFVGSSLSLDISIFEVPVSAYPLKVGDRLLVSPINGGGDAKRWGVVQKLTGGITIALGVSSGVLQVPGIGTTYGLSRLVVPTDMTIDAGKYYSIAATKVGNTIKYAVLNKYDSAG